ncbi:MAG: polysaccharide biosynthesis protein GumB [Xanthomonadaceae bacterium]|nr:polysaccharide biosynthesis protein GumB [Xanthomonadaceae bacterium]
MALLCAVGLSACASSGSSRPSASVAVLPDADPVAAALGRPEYRIGPSDLLTITVFQIQDLNRDVRVNNAGQISLPLIGAVDAAGRTVNELETTIASRYSARYLQNPQVSVFVKEFSSQRITVGGAVRKPGIFPLTTRLTLLQAIALSEGLTETGSEHNVVVFRTVKGKRQFARFDLAAIQRGDNPDPEIMGEDVIVVDTSTGKTFLQNLIRVAPLIGMWRYLP